MSGDNPFNDKLSRIAVGTATDSEVLEEFIKYEERLGRGRRGAQLVRDLGGGAENPQVSNMVYGLREVVIERGLITPEGVTAFAELLSEKRERTEVKSGDVERRR